MSMKKAYEDKLRAQLDEWNAEIGNLKAKADKAEANAKIEYYEQIEKLREQQQEAQAKLDELRRAAEDSWEDLKAGIENTWDSLGKAIKTAVSRFE